MRRALTWMAVCLLLLAAGALLVGHANPRARESLHMSAPEAALRRGESMALPWPEGDVNPNSDDPQELMRLYGVGAALAQLIMQERLQNGLYLYPEDLLTVRGIGPKTLEKLWSQIRLPYPDHQ